MKSATKPPEKRRFTRRGTHVEAVMAIESASIECIILDFCEQGLFLKLTQPSSVGLQKNKNTKIYFSATTDSGKEYFQIDAEIVRVADDGIGVSFENISDSMFNALIETTNAGSIAAYSPKPRFFLTSSNQELFKTAFKDFLTKNLPNLMREFFNYADIELEKNPEYTESFQDVAAQANLMSILRMNKDRLVQSFCGAVTKDISFTGDNSEHAKDKAPLNNGLSLVEKDAFEDWLNFSTLTRKINTLYKNQLYQLELKLSYVTCFPRYLIKNPIAPEKLCELFRQEIVANEESNAIKKALYKAFEMTLSNHLSALYQAFDALLVEHDAPSGIAGDITWKKNFPSTAKPDFAANSFGSGQQLPSFDNETYHYAEPTKPPQAGDFHSRPAISQPVSKTANKLFHLMNQGVAASHGQAPALTQGSDAETGEHYGGHEYSADELLTALTKLQASRTGQLLPQEGAALLQSQLGQALASSDYQGGKTFSPEDKAKLDVYDQLFQSLSNELSLTPGVKSYLENIKLPLMALTLQDPNFLDAENHPARNFLNQLSSLEGAINQNRMVKDAGVKQALDALIARVAHDSITNPDVFAKADEELKEISLPVAKSREANIRRVVEVYEGKQKLEQARQKIQLEIDKRLADKHIPNVIKVLLESGWQHLMVISELNDADEALRQRYLEVIDQLLYWYANLDQLPSSETHAIELELDFISNNLGSVCTNAFVHSKIMDELNETLLGTGSPLVKKPVDTTFIEPKALDTANDFISDSWLLQIDQFNKGDWFTFSLEKEAFEPLNLIWIGKTPEVYVFVNRDGHKRQELTRSELAELLQNGSVTQIENLDEPLMDRATTSMLQKMQEKLIYSVSHDPVTDLPNRKRFIHLLKEQLSNLADSSHVMSFLEIEDFRVITNVCGLLGGDQLLLQVAQSLSNQLGKDGIVSRLGDKTFGFLLKNCSPDAGLEAAKQVRNTINKANFVWDDKSYTISVSIGLVPITENQSSIEEIMQRADSVNISAKRAGHNQIRVYQENDESLKVQSDIHEWAGRIDRIFSENRLFARCQMIAPINPEKNTHTHYEILLGVIDEVGKIIVPDKFIPAVERCQRMPEIDRWIVNHVFDWIIQHKEHFEKIGGFAINLSGQSLNSEEFLTFLKDRLAMNDIPAHKITFEVTETVAAGSLVFTKRFIKEIKQFGCKFSLDDFGTGYSSYSYLKSLDVDYLKIDGSFIKDIANSPTDQVMVNSMNEIAHSLELETIAEYVENLTIHAILREIGVDYAQGWGIHKPMRLTELADTLADSYFDNL